MDKECCVSCDDVLDEAAVTCEVGGLMCGQCHEACTSHACL